MSNHNIYLIAYPTASALEERIAELLLNYYDDNDEEDIFACGVTDIPSSEAINTMKKMLAVATEEDNNE